MPCRHALFVCMIPRCSIHTPNWHHCIQLPTIFVRHYVDAKYGCVMWHIISCDTMVAHFWLCDRYAHDFIIFAAHSALLHAPTTLSSPGLAPPAHLPQTHFSASLLHASTFLFTCCSSAPAIKPMLHSHHRCQIHKSKAKPCRQPICNIERVDTRNKSTG